MSFYLYKANYSTDAVKAMVDKPQDREAAARGVIEALGGTLHHFFFALGDWDIIEVDKTLCNDHLATNHLILDDRTIVVPSEPAHDGVAAELKKRHFEVIRLPYEAVYRVGGSFRCAHHPLIRT